MTLLFTHPSAIEHDPGRGHPERPDRLKAVLRALDEPEFKPLQRREAPRATVDQIARAHDRRYVEALLAAVPKEGLVGIDPDTVMCPELGEAALRAAGAIIAAIDAVVAGEDSTAFCAVRPPGHHAEASRGMGFCLFNNVAIGAMHAREAHGVRARRHRRFRRPSRQRDPAHVRGRAERAVRLVPPISVLSGHRRGGGAWRRQRVQCAARRRIRIDRVPSRFRARDPPGVDRFRARSDSGICRVRCPCARSRWPSSSSAIPILPGSRIVFARSPTRSADGRVVSTLEGGYDLQALAAGATLHVRRLMA